MSDRRPQKSAVEVLEENGVLDYHYETEKNAPRYAYFAARGAAAEGRNVDGDGGERRDLRRETNRLNERVRQLRLDLPGDDDDLNDIVSWMHGALRKLFGKEFTIADADGVPHTLGGIVQVGDLRLWEKARREIREFTVVKKAELDVVNEVARFSDVVGVQLRKGRPKK